LTGLVVCPSASNRAETTKNSTFRRNTLTLV